MSYSEKKIKWLNIKSVLFSAILYVIWHNFQIALTYVLIELERNKL